MNQAVLVLACCTSLMGCLITRDPSFEQPVNVPPSVHGSAETPMYQIRIVDLDPSATPGLDAGPAQSSDIRFVATVRDANARDVLRGRVFLNLDREADFPTRTVVDSFDILPNLDGDPYSRNVQFTVTRSLFDPNCNTVELHVSRGFASELSLAPADTGDLGIGVWFIGGRDSSTPEPDLSGCEVPE